MNLTEDQLSTLLHEAAPEPPHALSAADVRTYLDRHAEPDRRNWLPIAVAAAVVALLVGAVTLVGAISHRSSPGSGPEIIGCEMGEFAISVLDSDSSPYAVIGMNSGGAPCRLDGYPTFAVEGSEAGGQTVATLPTKVTHGLSRYHDPGPHSMIVNGCVSFAVGAVTSASTVGGRQAVATDIQLRIPGHGGPVQVDLPGLALNARQGQPFGVGVTAYEKGCLRSPPTANAGPVAGNACSADKLAASATAPSGSATRPFSVIQVHNTSHTSCSITGYPSIALRGKVVYPPGTPIYPSGLPTGPPPGSLPSEWSAVSTPKTTDLHYTVSAGIPEWADHGARPIVLAPGQSASFALGTADGSARYRSRYLVQSVQFSLPGNLGRTTVSIPGRLFAESSTQAQLPVGVTAFAAGADAGR